MAQFDLAQTNFADFAAQKILVVGDVMLDHYVIGEVERLSPEAPVPILRVSEESNRPGGAANVALNVAALGGQATLVGLCGSSAAGQLDTDGQVLAKQCAAQGVETHFLPALSCTVRKTRVIAATQQIVRVDRETPLPNTAPTLDWELLKRLGRESSAIIISDYAKGMLTPELLAGLRACQRPLLLDPRPQHRDLYRGVDFITPNRQEALAILGAPADLPPIEIAAALAEKLACGILLTLGEQGMCLYERGAPPHLIPTRAQEVFDVTGAGDTVIATFAMALSCGLAKPQAAALANAAAGLAVAHAGCATINLSELKAALCH